MIDEAQRRGHGRDVFDAKVAALPELRKDLDEIGAQLIEREGTRLGVGHQAILRLQEGRGLA